MSGQEIYVHVIHRVFHKAQGEKKADDSVSSRGDLSIYAKAIQMVDDSHRCCIELVEKQGLDGIDFVVDLYH